ncbi:hypothetical protein HA402_003865 [Bradysia odoriphaga]|nr:hypothetical protein HA402_003865 [Bradysia odoriphaga]
MQPFTCFMDVENSRSYVDVLYSADYVEIQDALITLKNQVIGSNKQKGSVISQGLLPKLVSFITLDEVPLSVKLDAAIVIGSLAKGTESHVSALIDCRIVDIMLAIVSNPSTDKRLVEIALSVLRSIFQHPLAPIVEINTNTNFLKDIIGIATSDNSIHCQSCVANILVPLCHSFNEQMILCHTGAIPFLARLITTDYSILQIPALKCLAAMCFTNRTVSDVVCGFTYENKQLPDILTALLSRVKLSDIQLAAARCLTYIHRSDSLTSTDSRIVYRTLPCLARLCTNEFDEETRATAAETLAYLAEIDSELQRLAAISNHLISSLFELLKIKLSPLPRVGAFRCFASLGANDEDIRKRIIETKGLMEEVLFGLGDPSADVRLAAVRCLHSLSRSVQQLRTTFQDHSVWRPLMTLLQGTPSNELLTVVTSTICNLLLEFSPSKEPMVESGCCELLCELTKSPDAALRLNGSWALMNMAFQADETIKDQIISTLGTDRVLKLLSDSDSRVIMKTLGLLRNLLSKSMDIENIMKKHSSQLMQAVSLVLDSTHSSEVKEQALCIIGNIAHAAISTDYIMEDESILKKLLDFVTHKDCKLQKGAVIAIKNLIDKNDLNTSRRLMVLNDLGAVDKLEAYLSMATHLSEDVSNVRSLIRRLVGYT